LISKWLPQVFERPWNNQEFILLDADVAQIYGVTTRDVNKAVANNPDKFPAGYIVELTKAEKRNWWKSSTGSIG